MNADDRNVSGSWGPIAEEAGSTFDRYSDAELELIVEFVHFGRAFLATHTERVRALPPPGAAGGGPSEGAPGAVRRES